MYDDVPDVAVADVEVAGDAPVVTSFCVALVAIFFAAFVADCSEDAPVVSPLTVDSIVTSVRLGFTQTLC